MLNAPRGTVFCFHKHDLFRSTEHFLDYQSPWPLGFMDDGSVHQPRKMHSIRIPVPEGNPVMDLLELPIIHYSKFDLKRQRAKMRMYATLQNVQQSAHVFARRSRYDAHTDWLDGGIVKETPASWFTNYEKQGINLQSFPDEDVFWQDQKTLELIEEYGSKRFWRDDIWDADWRKIAQYYRKDHVKIISPPFLVKSFWRLATSAYQLALSVKSALRG